MRVADEDLAVRQDHHLHRRKGLDALARADDVADVLQVVGVVADRAAQHRVGVAAADAHRADERRPGAHVLHRLRPRHALAPRDLVVIGPVVAIARVVEDVHDLGVGPELHAQAELGDAGRDDVGAADEDRAREALVHRDLRRAQHALVLALGIHDALRCLLGRGEDRLHRGAGLVDEAVELVPIGIEVLDRPCRDAAVHRRLRDCRGHLDDQPGIERARDQVVGTERRRLLAVRERHDLGGLGLRDLRERPDGGELHLLVDRGRAHVQRAAEDEREAERVVHLVRVVGAAGADQAVRTDLLRELGPDLRLGVGHRQDDRLVGHLLDHLRLEHAAGGQAEEDIGAGDDVGERPGARVPGVALLVRVHALLATLVDHALRVGDQDVLRLQPQAHQQVEAGDRRRAGARARELHLADVLADDLEPVQHRRGRDDRRAVLVVVEDRDLHPLAQLLLDVEAFGRLDVLQVDAAEGRLERGDDLDQLVGVGFRRPRCRRRRCPRTS